MVTIKSKTVTATPRSKNYAIGSTVTKSGGGSTTFVADGNSHTHANKIILDGITKLLIDSWNGSSLASHTHANKLILDKIIALISKIDETTFTDTNILSSLRVLKEIKERSISKTESDTAAEIIKFLKGIEVGNYVENTSGGALKTVDGNSVAEVDILKVRKRATFQELFIQRLQHIGGELILSPASIVCNKVEEFETFYRCFYDKGDNGEVHNQFVVGDQARCQIFNGAGTKYYWRLVTAISEEVGFIDLSKSDCDTDSDIPAIGDNICQLGNRTDITRQNAQILSSFGDDAPSFKQYSGINSFSLPVPTTYWSRTGNQITGIVKFLSGKTAEEAISDAQNSAALDATTKANAAAALAYANSQTYVNTIKSDLQSQIDGNITSFFYDYEPALNNAPYSDWDSDSVRDIHLGDLFYWTSKGFAYRFQKVSGVYSWTLIKDSEVTKALQDAATAQAIANGKSTTFSVEPFTPYLVGDWWLNGGDLYSCIVARSSGVFVASDWSKEVKYTDDTAVNNLQIGGRNLINDSASRIKIAPAGDNYSFINLYALEKNTTYTLSLRSILQAGAATQFTVNIFSVLSNVGFTSGLLDINSVNRQKYTFTTPDTSTIYNLLLYAGVAGSTSGNTIEFLDIKLERGNKATDYTEAPEDTALKIAAVEAKANLSKAITDKFGTTIDGALIQAVITLLRELNSETETAGISGMQGDGTLPAVWAGGTYAEAIASIAKIIFRHNGSWQLAGGNLRGDVDGKLTFGKEGDGESVDISTGLIPSQTVINNREVYPLPVFDAQVVKDLNNPAHSGIDVNSSYSQEFTLEHDGFLTVDSAVGYSAGADIVGFGIDGFLYVEKFNGATWDIVFQGESDALSIYLSRFQEPLTKGRYRLRWEVTCGYTSVEGSDATIILSKYCEISYKLNVKRLVVGIDGIALFDSMTQNMFRLSLADVDYLLDVIGNFKWSSPDTLKSLKITNDGIKTNGATDFSGALASGSIAVAGAQVTAKRWGAKADYSHDATKVSAGYYRVPVLADNANYTISIAPRSAQRTFYLGTQTSTYFDVYFYVGSTLTDTPFDFQIFGNNA